MKEARSLELAEEFHLSFNLKSAFLGFFKGSLRVHWGTKGNYVASKWFLLHMSRSACNLYRLLKIISSECIFYRKIKLDV